MNKFATHINRYLKELIHTEMDIDIVFSMPLRNKPTLWIQIKLLVKLSVA